MSGFVGVYNKFDFPEDEGELFKTVLDKVYTVSDWAAQLSTFFVSNPDSREGRLASLLVLHKAVEITGESILLGAAVSRLVKLFPEKYPNEDAVIEKIVEIDDQARAEVKKEAEK